MAHVCVCQSIMWSTQRWSSVAIWPIVASTLIDLVPWFHQRHIVSQNVTNLPLWFVGFRKYRSGENTGVRTNQNKKVISYSIVSIKEACSYMSIHHSFCSNSIYSSSLREVASRSEFPSNSRARRWSSLKKRDYNMQWLRSDRAVE